MDRLGDIALFLRVLDLGSITAAAHSLDLSVAVASQRLKRLERDLGVRLLHRTTRRMHPTAEGQQLAARGRVLVDDLVDTAGTLCAAAAALKQRGALKVVAYITHPVLSGPAVDNINNSQLDELVVTDTIPLSAAARTCPKIRQLSVAELLAETIRRIAFGESVSSLYVD